MLIEQARISAMHLETEYPVESAVLKSEESLALEDQGYQVWIDTVFPDYFDCEFLPEHDQLWTWGWKFLIALRDRQPLPPDANAFLDLLSRNYGKSMHCEAFMAAAVCVVGYGIFLYVSGSQDLANEHLSNIEGLLTSQGVMQWYPEHSRPKKSQITGANRGWTQKKLMTEGGATVWAIGLLVGVRGIRKGKERVRGFVLDDVDDYDDSPQVALKKANTLASSVLPTSDTEFFVIGAQNLITEHSVFNRIYTKQDTMLAHRAIAGPLKAFENLVTEFVDGRDMIISGESNWPERVTPAVCQRFIDTYGLIRFMAEFQHDFSSNKQGLCLDNYDDNVHVITKSEFAAVFGTREIPTRWWKYQFHDHARTKTAYHANVTGTVAVSSMNEKLPGFIFLFNLMSFPAQTEAEEVALRILKGISPTVEFNHQKRLWDELVESSLHRANLEQFSFDLTKQIRMRRATLAKIIPPVVPPLLAQKNYKAWRMSHEAINAAGRVYKEVFGLPFAPCLDEGEVLTEDGWIAIQNIRVGDRVLSSDKRGSLSLKRVSATQQLAYSGPMIRVRKKNLYQSFTPDHQILHRGDSKYSNRANWKLTRWNEHRGTFIQVIRAPLTYEPESVYRPPFKLPARRFLPFLGLFLSEGSTRKRTTSRHGFEVQITQRTESKQNAVRLALRGLPWKFSLYKNGDFHTSSRELWSYLQQFGYAHEKFVPREIMRSASSAQLRILLKWLMFGDGSVDSNGTTMTYYSTSKRLADDVMEIGLKLGYKAQITTDDRPHPKHRLRYVVYLAKNLPSTCVRKSDASSEPFNGIVYDLTVEDNHSFVVRQQGKVWISGNCNPGADGGLELFNHYLKVDYTALHPFGVNENRPDGRGFTRTLIVVEDNELAYTADVSPERLHDAALCRYQFNHWRYTTPTLNDKGEKEWGPQKMNDDFGNGMMMLFHDNMPQAAPLNRNETIHEYLPVAIKDETINSQPQLTGEEKGKLLTLQQLKMKQIAKQIDKKPTRNVLGNYRRFTRGK